MANVENYGWAYVHPTASQAQARGVTKSIQFVSGAVDSNGIGTASGSAKFTFDYVLTPPQLFLSGNMTSSGHVSASTYYGDGSNLDNISPFPHNGNAVITGSLTVTNSITASNYLIENTFEVNNNGSSISLDDYYIEFSRNGAGHMADFMIQRSIGDNTSATYRLVEIKNSEPRSWRILLDPDIVRWRELGRERERERGENK